MDSSEVRIIMALDHSLAFKVGIRHLWNRAPKTPKMPLTLVKMAVKIENFVKCFVVIKFMTLFILYTEHTKWLWTLIADLVFEILISFKFYLVYYCHKGIVKSFEVICFTFMWVKTMKLYGGVLSTPPLPPDGNRVKIGLQILENIFLEIKLCI